MQKKGIFRQKKGFPPMEYTHKLWGADRQMFDVNVYTS